MSHIRTKFALSALPVSTVAGGVAAGCAREYLWFICSIPPRHNNANTAHTTISRRQFDGIAIQH